SEIHGALLDRVVQDHGDGFKLLHEFSSPNRPANGEGECTIRALSSTLFGHGAPTIDSQCLSRIKTMKEWYEQADLARSSLDKAAKKMKKWADKKRDTSSSRYEGPFPVIGCVGKVSYRVQLPPKLKIHPVFHVSFLKPYHGDEEDPKRGVSKRAPTAVVTSYDREVEEILSDRTIRRRGVSSYKEYLVKWRDLPDSEASWEAEDLLW
ncbi:putative retrotransposon gag domain, aspartic peptidase domain protein, partial [Tanacetum coccineum]